MIINSSNYPFASRLLAHHHNRSYGNKSFLISTRCSSTEVALLAALPAICATLCKKPNSMFSLVLLCLKFVSKVRQPPINNTRVDLLIVYFYFRPSAAVLACPPNREQPVSQFVFPFNSSGWLAGVRSLAVDSLSFSQSLYHRS